MGDLTKLGREVRRLTKGRRRRYPPKLKARILRAVRQGREAGHTWSVIVEEVGVPLKTLRQWRADDDTEEAELKPVTVVPEVVQLGGRELVVETPAGYRIEGLDVDGAAALLRKLSS